MGGGVLVHAFSIAVVSELTFGALDEPAYIRLVATLTADLVG